MLIEQRFPRVTAPHLPSLAVSITTELAKANAGSFHLRYASGEVIVEQASWVGVTLATIQAAVDAAPADTAQLQAKDAVDALPRYLQAIVLVLVDEINRLRQNPTTVYPIITAAQAWSAVKAKVDTL